LRFGPFEITERRAVAGGGFDASARDESGKDVCLWVGCAGSAARAAELESLRRRLAVVYHASLPRVLGTAIAEDRACLVLAPYAGPRLDDALAGGPLPPPDAIDLVRAVAAGLVKAHKAAVPHGALTAGEIVLAEDGRALLLHLGWGPFLEPREPRAPEDLAAPGGSEGGDVFALARLLVQCLEGADPVPPGRDALAAFASGAAPARTADSFAPSLPEGLRRLLARALHPDPQRRMRRAEELAGDLGVLRASWDSLHAPPPRPSIPFPPLLNPGVLAALALGLGVAALVLVRSCAGQKPG
jgi:serine/threonine protein kinase